MTTKPETVFQQVSELSKHHSIPLLQFKDWLVEEEEEEIVNYQMLQIISEF